MTPWTKRGMVELNSIVISGMNTFLHLVHEDLLYSVLVVLCDHTGKDLFRLPGVF